MGNQVFMFHEITKKNVGINEIINSKSIQIKINFNFNHFLEERKKNSEQADSNHRPKDNFIFINLLQSSALPSELCSVSTFFFFLFSI